MNTQVEKIADAIKIEIDTSSKQEQKRLICIHKSKLLPSHIMNFN